MGIGPFSSSSETLQETFASNQQIGAAGNAAVNAPRRSGNTVVKLARGATYTVYNGLDEDTFFDRFEKAIGLRAENQIAAGGEAAVQDALGKLGLGNWILIGVGIVGVGVAIFWRRKK
jgi:hypothetical protein